VDQQKSSNKNCTPVLCVETENKLPHNEQQKIREDLLLTASKRDLTKNIKTIIFNDEFPVDIRHNSKIFREKLKTWATKELGVKN
jgi:hypothetical protein